MNTYKGILHVHSNYSHDGRHSPEEIARFAKIRGCHFVCMSEHSDTLSEEKMIEYVTECRKASHDDCLIIPGIEFTCDNGVHLLGFGVEHYTSEADPLQIAEFIHQQNGVAIVAHPSRYNYRISEKLAAVVDGIEVWNATYDGRFVPNDRSLRLLRNLKKVKKELLAFCGQDLHRIRNHRNVELSVTCDALNTPSVLSGLKERTVAISSLLFSVKSTAEPRWQNLVSIAGARYLYHFVKWMRDHLALRKSKPTEASKATS